MPGEIKDKHLQQRFLDAVKELGLRFEVADIAKATDVGESIVSTYLNSGRQVSRPFLRKFCEVFELDYDYIATGRKKAENEEQKAFSPEQLYAMFMEVAKVQTSILENIQSEMAREKTLAKVISSLDRIHEAENAGFGLVGELVYRSVVRDAAGNPEKMKRDLADILERIGPGLGATAKKGIRVDEDT